MTEKNILELARLGNPNAIASLMNQSLHPQGINSTAKLSRDCLYIFVESIQVPHQPSIVEFIYQGMMILQVESVKTVKIYGRKLGEEMAAWSQEFEMDSPIEPTILETAPSLNYVERIRTEKKVKHPSSPAKKNKAAPVPVEPSRKSQKGASIFRNLERIFLVLVTFLLTTVFWDKLGTLMPSDRYSELNQIYNSFMSQINQRHATIAGGAWVTKEGGNSDILRGLEIVLCKASVKPEIMHVRDSKWREIAAKYKNQSGYWYLNIEAMNSKVAAHKDCLDIVKTGIEGKYIIPEIPFGSYIIYAPYETSFSKAYWIVPVEVKSTKPLQIDLDNSNMTELYNQK